MVLLPEADCWTKATKQKPTNPRLARIKACIYMLTFTVVEHEHFLRSTMRKSTYEGVCVCVCACVCECVCYKGLVIPSEHPLIGYCAIPLFLFAPAYVSFE